jgi:hypothetical protein
MKKPPLGEVPWLPPYGYCENHIGSRYQGDPCPNCVPAGGPHLFVLPTATPDQLRSFWLTYIEDSNADR